MCHPLDPECAEAIGTLGMQRVNFGAHRRLAVRLQTLPPLPDGARGDAGAPRHLRHRHPGADALEDGESPRRGQSCILVRVHRASGWLPVECLDNPSFQPLRPVNNLSVNYS